jgi:hypothetical protein
MACKQTILSAKRLNNEGYCLIKNDRYDEAVVTLMQALRETKKTAVEARNERRVSSCSQGSSRDTHPSSTTSPSQVEICTPVNMVDAETTFVDLAMQDQLDSPSQSPYMYTEPVFITDQLKASKDDSITTLSFIIMFNLALSHHLKGNSSEGVSSRKSLEIAKRLYELTFQMQAQEVETNLLLMSSLLNNLSLVHKALDNQHEAEQCDQLLLSALLLLVDMGEMSRDSGSDLYGFMGNVMHLMIKGAPVASAA